MTSIVRRRGTTTGLSSGIAWVECLEFPDLIAAGAWVAPSDRGPATPATPADPDPEWGPNDATLSFPQVGSDVQIDSNTGDPVIVIGFAVPPGVWVATHVWAIRAT